VPNNDNDGAAKPGDCAASAEMPALAANATSAAIEDLGRAAESDVRLTIDGSLAPARHGVSFVRLTW
jgi:hypothetical protein